MVRGRSVNPSYRTVAAAQSPPGPVGYGVLQPIGHGSVSHQYCFGEGVIQPIGSGWMAGATDRWLSGAGILQPVGVGQAWRVFQCQAAGVVSPVGAGRADRVALLFGTGQVPPVGNGRAAYGYVCSGVATLSPAGQGVCAGPPYPAIGQGVLSLVGAGNLVRGVSMFGSGVLFPIGAGYLSRKFRQGCVAAMTPIGSGSLVCYAPSAGPVRAFGRGRLLSVGQGRING